ncbi:uncharacterized protein LOC120822077 [Gasterosteus aculeatus]
MEENTCKTPLHDKALKLVLRDRGIQNAFIKRNTCRGRRMNAVHGRSGSSRNIARDPFFRKPQRSHINGLLEITPRMCGELLAGCGGDELRLRGCDAGRGKLTGDPFDDT